MNPHDHEYFRLLNLVKEKGVFKDDRTGTGCYSTFGAQARFDLQEGFPLLTTKKIHTRSVIYELLWFLQGRTDNQWLEEHGVTIWKEWSTAEQCARFGRKEGDLGPIYGALWRNFGATLQDDGSFKNDGVDQIARLLHDLKEKPNSRRHLLTGWDPKTCDTVALPPCHTVSQYYVAEGKLSCQLYQRSADLFLGVPFNIASYSLLTHMLAQVCGLQPGEFVHTFGDIHIYSNHMEQVEKQLSRDPRPAPKLVLNPEVKDLLDFQFEDITFLNYNPHPGIKAPVAV